MSFLLDTNVISEWTKPWPDPGVIRWLSEVDEDRVFISVVTLAELRHGIERLPVGSRRQRLDAWLRHELTPRFEGRILTIDGRVADLWGQIMARSQAAGRSAGPMDGFIAATAQGHDLVVVTRNDSDFRSLGIRWSNPWTSESGPEV